MEDLIKNFQNLPSGMVLAEFSSISILKPNSTVSSAIGINFNDSTQPASFNVDFVIKGEPISRSVSIKAPVGEIIRSVLLPETLFIMEKDKLKGMNEHSVTIQCAMNRKLFSQKILENANVAVISSDDSSIR